ncbi:MAG: FAD-binding oxidoreductase, partial [Planctomycetales bacterium]|nr:FAD-binding oxidoreductase [Planctomycetales bacterium]
MPTATALTRLESELRTNVAGEVRFDEMTRGLYSTDASIYQIQPVGVVFPRTTHDVTETVRIAAEHRVPIVPRGGGTSLSGQSVGPAIILDFSRFMNRILHLDPERRLVRVEPGVVLDQLNAAANAHDLQFGPDVATSSRANLGGMIGNNSAGSRSVQQGKVIDHVRELRVALSDGTELHCRPMQEVEEHENRIAREVLRIVAENRQEIVRRYPRILRRVSGYNLDAFIPEIQDQFPIPAAVKRLDSEWPDRREFNLARMIVGAEGTLGVVTEAVLHLVPLPKERGVVCLQFETIDAALVATLRILECQPSAVELLDRNIIELSRSNLKYRKSLDFIEGTPDAILIVEFSGDTPTQVADGIELLRVRIGKQAGLQKWLQAVDAEQREKIWNCRKAGAPLLLSIPGARKPIAFVEDPAVEPSKMPEFTRRFKKILDRHGVTGAYYGHASVGCLHLRPMIDTKSAGDLKILKSVSDDVAELVREFGGAMSGEHGDGLARSYHNLKLFGPKLFAAFGEVKRLFDPLGIMNPGKVVASPSPIENLRYGPKYRGAPVQSFLDFSREAAMAGLADNSTSKSGEPEGVSPRTSLDTGSGGLRPPAR